MSCKLHDGNSNIIAKSRTLVSNKDKKFASYSVPWKSSRTQLHRRMEKVTVLNLARDLHPSFQFAMKPVLLTLLIVLSEVLISPESHLLVKAASSPSSTSSVTTVNHNRLYSDATLRKKYDPYDDEFLDFGKESSNIKRSRGRDDFDSRELERAGGASGRPLSTSAKESLKDYRDRTGCPQEFNGYCTCGETSVENLGNKYVVNCTDAGFSTPTVLENLPPNTEVLIFTGNMLKSLPINIFGSSKTYPDLVYIDMSANGIESILGKTFHRVNAVETLILNNNKISQFTLKNHQRIFSNFLHLKSLHLSTAFEANSELLTDLREVFIESNLTKLEKIHLENNGIDYINEPNVFCELPSLMHLHMAQNKLSDLNLDITCLKQARYIDLTYNKIHTVGENSGLWKLLHEKNQNGEQIQVNLWNNPFECDCKLDAFIELVRNWTKINADVMPYGERLICEDGLPKNNTHNVIKDIFYTECAILKGSDYGSTAVSAIAWILGVIFLLGIGYFLHVNQNLLCRPVSPLHQTTTQGVKYTTIQEEEAEVAHV